ncbi:MAG: ACT domain-containing protein [Desulfosalsimonadaceae bacterium]|nr:ACT domain-containing protein [Desulfosalsimonadaceae bacterium]
MPITDLDQLIKRMQPVLNPGVFAFVSVNSAEALKSVTVIASIWESEGYSAVIEERDALSLGLKIMFRAGWITLNVNSDLQAVGLTAAFAGALGKAGISCNVVAGAWHDHIFVPIERASAAMDVLKNLQKSVNV